ncbi:MAG: ParA family protein, partial [Chitinophagales bacterium]
NMGKVITFSNHKGGVGKTTSTVNVGVALSQMGQKVLLIDLDPQANLTQSFGITKADFNIYEALIGRYELRWVSINENLDVVPSTLDLSGAEIELSGEPGREFILRELIEPIRDQYDYILLDTPPSLGLLTVNALATTNAVYIPLQAEYLALQGLTKLTTVIRKIQRRLNRKLELGGVFLTQYDNRKILNREVAQTVADFFKDKVFKTKIRNNISLAEAPSLGKDIFNYSKKSNGAKDYMSLSKEIIARNS